MYFISCKYLPIVFSFCIIASCTKNTNRASPHTGADIYVAGDNGTNPVLWKNGSANMLSTSIGTASQVIVSGNNVYVAGVDGESASSLLSPGGPGGQYVYWKNGIQNNISVPEFIRDLSSVSVSGGDIYYTNMSAWKNGTKITLPGQGQGYVTSTLAAGTDIYFTGSDSTGDAVYWKNNLLHVIAQGYYPASNSGSDPSAYCIFVSGDDVYMGGIDINNTAVYWKNGVATTLHSPISGSYVTNVHSLFVAGDDVYVLGNIVVPTGGGVTIPAYWKNGVEYDLPLNGASFGSTTSIFVSGPDVYIAGEAGNAAVYWKNGVETILSSAGSANSIYVQ
jgi:putative NIF3 family GTP cyclohydrolase 1 type 2